jgi:excisionase family DNA binding protein
MNALEKPTESGEDDVCEEEEAARILGGISVSTLRKHARAGRVPSFKVGNLRKYRRSSLKKHIEEAERLEAERAKSERRKVLGLGVVRP